MVDDMATHLLPLIDLELPPAIRDRAVDLLTVCRHIAEFGDVLLDSLAVRIEKTRSGVGCCKSREVDVPGRR